MAEPWGTLIPLFGPFAAIAIVMWFVFKHLKGELDEVKQENKRLADEREQAKDTLIAAFGDIADGFVKMAGDVRDYFDDHETGATSRHDKLLDAMEKHKNEIIEKLDGHRRDISR